MYVTGQDLRAGNILEVFYSYAAVLFGICYDL